MTVEELEKKVIELTERCEELEKDYLYLRKWSDDNDFVLREMIDALTESVEKNHELIYRFHYEDSHR